MSARSGGFTLIELIVTMLIVATLATAFVSLAVPQFNLFFFLPQRQKVQTAAMEMMNVVFEGDPAAPGLRFAEPTTSSSAITEATSTTLTFTYQDDLLANHTVRFVYSEAADRLTRQVDAGAAQPVPYYAGVGSGLSVLPAETAFFRYFDQTGAEFVPTAGTLGDIYRVDVAARMRSGTGAVADSEGGMTLKSGVEIKHFTA